jgi:hypothetical protein
MATREDVRVALVNAVELLKATWVGYPLLVEYDNRITVNRSTQSDPFLCVNLRYMGGEQVALGENGGHRLSGVLELEANVKQGQGSKLANDLLSHFYPSLHMTDAHYPLRTYAARFSSKPPKDGWDKEVALIPFWFDVL